MVSLTIGVMPNFFFGRLKTFLVVLLTFLGSIDRGDEGEIVDNMRCTFMVNCCPYFLVLGLMGIGGIGASRETHEIQSQIGSGGEVIHVILKCRESFGELCRLRNLWGLNIMRGFIGC